MGRVPRLLIGAARSGSGKTLITCALLKTLQKRKNRQSPSNAVRTTSIPCSTGRLLE